MYAIFCTYQQKAVILHRQTKECLAVLFFFNVFKTIMFMKTKIIALVLCAILTMPCMLRAEEVEIQLMELTQMGVPLGDDPLDGPAQDPTTPTRPTSFPSY